MSCVVRVPPAVRMIRLFGTLGGAIYESNEPPTISGLLRPPFRRSIECAFAGLALRPLLDAVAVRARALHPAAGRPGTGDGGWMTKNTAAKVPDEHAAFLAFLCACVEGAAVLDDEWFVRVRREFARAARLADEAHA